MVASVDSTFSQFPGAIHVQTTQRQEMVSAIEEMFIDRLQLYWDRMNRRLPDNILVYRDGVSESQYQTVREQELVAFKTAIERAYKAKGLSQRPRITIVICGKRHNTRFYPTSNENSKTDNVSNPKNGTVVDRGITEPSSWEFFLQAHNALQGTARPCHYFVVHDEIFAADGKPQAADKVETLTHNLCYMFGRATRAVSYCPPAYYADKLCERARVYLRDEFDPEMRSSNCPDENTAEFNNLRDRQRARSTIHAHLKDTMVYI